MKITPLALLSPNWAAVTGAFKDLKINPLRKIDAEGLDSNDPGAYLGSLSSKYTGVREALRHDERLLDHSFASFLIEVDSQIGHLLYDSDVQVYRQKDHTYVVSGTIHHWVNTIASMSRNEETREIANILYSYFNRCLFGECFYHYERKTINDLPVFTWKP